MAVIMPDAGLWVLEIRPQGWAHPQSIIRPGEHPKAGRAQWSRECRPGCVKGPDAWVSGKCEL